jgi:phosphonate metabolism-associated iron-containing alcohol dehydrogenase
MWNYHNPVHIHFGVDCFDTIASLIAGRSYAVVTYDEAYFSGLVDRLAEAAGVGMLINNITPNPDFAMLSTSCAMLTGSSKTPDVIVSVGGGSVMDAGKVLAVGRNGFDAVRENLESKGMKQSLPAQAIPLIAVPTTAGTGSEVTSWATVWDSEAKAKYSLARDDLYPTDAVIDPGLMNALPRELTISTGLDALSHALESLWNINANPVSTNFAIAAAREILECLGPLAEDLGNNSLRTRMAQAATMAGLAFSNTRTALAHSLSYPVTLHHGISHGIACSFTLPRVMRSGIGASPACDNALRRIFGENLEDGSQSLAGFLNGLGVAADHSSLGIRDDEWRSWVNDAIDGERGRNFIGLRERVRDVFF